MRLGSLHLHLDVADIQRRHRRILLSAVRRIGNGLFTDAIQKQFQACSAMPHGVPVPTMIERARPPGLNPSPLFFSSASLSASTFGELKRSSGTKSSSATTIVPLPVAAIPIASQSSRRT